MANVEKLARFINGAFHHADDGSAVDVDIEDGEEDGDADHGPEMKIGFLHFLNADDKAVGGRDDDGFIRGDDALGIAEEVENEEE